MNSKGSYAEHVLNNSHFVKTILMLLVILYHSCVYWTGDWWDSNPAISSMELGCLANWLNSFHVYAFTLVSGYLFAYKTIIGGYNSFSRFICGKIKRLIIPYIFVSAVWLIPISCLLFNMSWERVFTSYVLCVSPDQLWFLWMLFGVFVIVWPIRKVFLEKPVCGCFIALGFHGVGLVGKSVLPNVFCVWTALQFIPFFFIGMCIRQKEEKNRKSITDSIPWFVWIALHLIVFVGITTIGKQEGAIWSIAENGMNLLLHILGGVMAFSVLQMVADHISWRTNNPFRLLSSYTMPMFLFHQQIIYFTIIWLDGKVNPWLHAGINLAIALSLSFIISHLLMQRKWTRFLVGEK